MRRFVLFVLHLTLATSALGFGLSQASAQYILPMPIGQTKSVYDWRGFYVGGHAGYGWRHVNISQRLNTVFGNILEPWSYNTDGTFGGLQIGYNFAVTQKLVAGFELDMSAGNIRGDAFPRVGSDHSTSIVHWFSTVRGRIGYSFGNILIFGTGGGALINAERQRHQYAGTTNQATLGTVETASWTKFGWTIGGGVEAGLTRHWTIRADYLYLSSFEKLSIVWPLAKIQSDEDLKMHIVRLGANYKF